MPCSCRLFGWALSLSLITVPCIGGTTTLERLCAFNACKAGEHVTTVSTKGAPAIGCADRDAFLYANFVVRLKALGIDENNAPGDIKSNLDEFRGAARVSSFQEAMKRCWPVANGLHVVIEQYTDRGAVKVKPKGGGASYWAAAAQLEH